MRFTITHRKDNDLSLVVLEDKESGSEATIIPAFGALLHSFSIPVSGVPFNIIDNYHSLNDLKDTLSSSYKSSKLSPFPCRIKEGKYQFGGKEFELLKKFPDGSAIHGLLFDQAFEVTDEKATETGASVTMQYHYKENDPGYPFQYNCLVKYQLKRDGILQVETALLNTGKELIPIADGWHPYFTLGGKANEWILSFHAASMVEFDENLIPTGKLVPNSKFTVPEKIDGIFLDNCFKLDAINGEPSCILENPKNGLQLLFYPGSHYPFLQIYTPPHRNSIAIENLSGAPNCFNNGMGLLLLKPGHSQTFGLTYQLLSGNT